MKTKKIKILGYEYTLSIPGTTIEMNRMGYHDLAGLEIRIAANLNRQQQLSTLLHEFIEAIKAAFELEIDHQAICALESCLFSILKDNGVDLTPLLEGMKNETSDD